MALPYLVVLIDVKLYIGNSKMYGVALPYLTALLVVELHFWNFKSPISLLIHTFQTFCEVHATLGFILMAPVMTFIQYLQRKTTKREKYWLAMVWWMWRHEMVTWIVKDLCHKNVLFVIIYFYKSFPHSIHRHIQEEK